MVHTPTAAVSNTSSRNADPGRPVPPRGVMATISAWGDLDNALRDNTSITHDDAANRRDIRTTGCRQLDRALHEIRTGLRLVHLTVSGGWGDETRHRMLA